MMNTNTPNDSTTGVPGFNEYGYVGGTRVWKKTNQNGTIVHRVYVDAGPNLIAEYNAEAGANSPAQEYVYADQIDSLVMIQRSGGQRLGVTRNRQWSVTALHDLANGNVVERYSYDMLGKAPSGPGMLPTKCVERTGSCTGGIGPVNKEPTNAYGDGYTTKTQLPV